MLNTLITEGVNNVTEELDNDATSQQKAEATMRWLCRRFYDIRTFGAVLSTGAKGDVMTGSAYGQVRGPVQFNFAQSEHPITPLEVTIMRCAVTKEEDVAKERTMGNKHIVPYGLYVAQALCLEEMLEVEVPRGAIFHIKSKRRREVEFTNELRKKTEDATERLRELVTSGRTPPPVLKPRCDGCSLREHSEYPALVIR